MVKTSVQTLGKHVFEQELNCWEIKSVYISVSLFVIMWNTLNLKIYLFYDTPYEDSQQKFSKVL